MITEDFVSFDVAKLLKEKEFDAEGVSEFGGYYVDYYHTGERTGIVTESMMFNRTLEDWECLRPTLQMVMKWLREAHSLEIYPYHDNTSIYNSKWWFEIIKYPNTVAEYESGKDEEFDSYEQACESAIKYCLENLI